MWGGKSIIINQLLRQLCRKFLFLSSGDKDCNSLKYSVQNLHPCTLFEAMKSMCAEAGWVFFLSLSLVLAIFINIVIYSTKSLQPFKLQGSNEMFRLQEKMAPGEKVKPSVLLCDTRV